MKRWTVDDVMTRDVATVGPTMGYTEIADLLVGRGISAVPVIDKARTVLGVVSEADLLPKIEYADRLPHHPLATRRANHLRRQAAGSTAREAMSTPAITVTSGASLVDVARRLDSARVKRLPVVDVQGHLIGIVSRRDLVRLYTRPDAEIRGDVVDMLCAAFQTELMELSVDVVAGIVTIGGQVARHSMADLAGAVSTAVPGVVAVRNELRYSVDDHVEQPPAYWSVPVV
jgi:CBS domain-containing protein